jgi:hypothetical protein
MDKSKDNPVFIQHTDYYGEYCRTEDAAEAKYSQVDGNARKKTRVNAIKMAASTEGEGERKVKVANIKTNKVDRSTTQEVKRLRQDEQIALAMSEMSLRDLQEKAVNGDLLKVLRTEGMIPARRPRGLWYVNLYVASVMTAGLIDYGSEISLVNKRTVKVMDQKSIEMTGKPLMRVKEPIAVEHLADKKGSMKTVESVMVPATWVNVSKSRVGVDMMQLFVLDMGIDLLLGLDYLEDCGWQLNTKKRTLTRETDEGKASVKVNKLTNSKYEGVRLQLEEVRAVRRKLYRGQIM